MMLQILRAAAVAAALMAAPTKAYAQLVGTVPAENFNLAALSVQENSPATRTNYSREAYMVEIAPPGTSSDVIAARWKEWQDSRSEALKWEIGYLTLSAVDAVQTIECLGREGCDEVNPFLGKKPSAGKVILFKTALGVGHFLMVQELNRRNPKTALRAAQISVGIQGAAVALNLASRF